MDKFHWLRQEVKKIEGERLYYKEKCLQRDRFMFLKLTALLLFILTAIGNGCLDAKQEDSQVIIEWRCSCGYDNYDQIGYCGICGSRRPWGSR
jgi:hypothetical protein